MRKNNVMTKSAINRRTCLKGAGAALALPLLDVMGWAEAAENREFKPPVRLGFMYMPHGVIMDQFWPKDAEGFLTSPPPALESLKPVLDQCLMMKGIAGVANGPFKNAPHALELSTWLTAAIEARQKEAAMEKAGIRSSRKHESDSPPIEIKIPEGDKRSEYMQMMCDLNVLAFQTDTTRVCTYIGSTPNGVTYPELGFTRQHHALTHHNNKQDMVEKVAAITKFNIDQFAYMVNKMASLREGEGTLLDNCIMMWGSGLEDGDRHSRQNLPFIIAGKGGGSIKTGRFLHNIKGNQGDLLTTLLSCAGVTIDRPVGIATKQIDEIKA